MTAQSKGGSKLPGEGIQNRKAAWGLNAWELGLPTCCLVIGNFPSLVGISLGPIGPKITNPMT